MLSWSDVSCWCLGTNMSLHLRANACVCNFVFLLSRILILSVADDYTPLQGEEQKQPKWTKVSVALFEFCLLTQSLI